MESGYPHLKSHGIVSREERIKQFYDRLAEDPNDRGKKNGTNHIEGEVNQSHTLGICICIGRSQQRSNACANICAKHNEKRQIKLHNPCSHHGDNHTRSGRGALDQRGKDDTNKYVIYNRYNKNWIHKHANNKSK